MAGRDLRVPMGPMLDAFGLAITVTRPAPDDDPIVTTGIWVPPPLEEQRPIGTDFQRREPRKVLAILRDVTLPTLPRGSTILAPEELLGPMRNWRVDGFDQPVKFDEWRVIVVQIADP